MTKQPKAYGKWNKDGTATLNEDMQLETQAEIQIPKQPKEMKEFDKQFPLYPDFSDEDNNYYRSLRKEIKQFISQNFIPKSGTEKLKKLARYAEHNTHCNYYRSDYDENVKCDCGLTSLLKK